jgi:hypothetical protein
VKLQALKPRLSTLVTQRIPSAPAGTDRMRGRAAVNRRDRYLHLHPLCVQCTKQGRVGAAMVVDHTVPLWAGGADDYETNGQGLCNPDHDAKTACEARMRAAGGWLSTPCQCGQHAHGAA